MSPSAHAYGPAPDQFLELSHPPPVSERNGCAVPQGNSLPVGGPPAPVVVVLHGGFWRAAHGIELARPLAADLAAHGYAAVAVEYRRVGAGGGWPETVEDVAAALDSLPTLPAADRLDLGDVTVIGHSAGGHLAAWAAGRGLLPAGAPGAGPAVRVAAAVLQAGVLDLELAAEQGMGAGAVLDFLGAGPAAQPQRYRLASPVRLVPTGADTLCVHGAADTAVPMQQSERYAAAATAAGQRVDVVAVPGDHLALIDPAGEPWRIVLHWLAARQATTRSG